MTMQKTCAIIPVKELTGAKQRLANVLSPDARAALALAMLDDVFDTLDQVAGLTGAFVVTADPTVAALAQKRGARILAETRSSGINTAVRLGLAEARAQGFANALILPADVPLATSTEIARIIRGVASAAAERIVLVPSRDADGTNGLLLSPTSVFEPSYGEGSFIRHLSQGVARQWDVEVLQLPGLGCDIDEPADLEVLHEARKACPRYGFLNAQSRRTEQEMIQHGG